MTYFHEIECQMTFQMFKCFEGSFQWKYPFYKNSTRTDTFNGGRFNAIADFMSGETNLESAELEELEATLVVLPYVEDKYKMVIFHPFPNSTIDDLEQKLFQETSGNIGGYIRRVRSEMTLLRVPKFTVEYEVNLAEALKQLNVTAVFSEAALLTEITSSHLHVQD